MNLKNETQCVFFRFKFKIQILFGRWQDVQAMNTRYQSNTLFYIKRVQNALYLLPDTEIQPQNKFLDCYFHHALDEMNKHEKGKSFFLLQSKLH